MLVDAWRKDTGEKLPHRVPAHYFDHPVLGENLTSKPPAESKPADEKKGGKK